MDEQGAGIRKYFGERFRVHLGQYLWECFVECFGESLTECFGDALKKASRNAFGNTSLYLPYHKT